MEPSVRRQMNSAGLDQLGMSANTQIDRKDQALTALLKSSIKSSMSSIPTQPDDILRHGSLLPCLCIDAGMAHAARHAD